MTQQTSAIFARAGSRSSGLISTSPSQGVVAPAKAGQETIIILSCRAAEVSGAAAPDPRVERAEALRRDTLRAVIARLEAGV